jgi:hypothetical protein
MTDHPTLEPPAAVRIRAGEPSGAAPAAAFVDVVCADHELLDAEFNAIIAANFPDAAGGGQRLRPGTAVATATRRVSARRMLASPLRRAIQGCAGAAHHLRARQRGPPGQPHAGQPHAGPHENRDVEGTSRTGGGGFDRHDHRSEGAEATRRSRSPTQQGVHVLNLAALTPAERPRW